MDLLHVRSLRPIWWLAFAGVALFYLVTAHRAHLAGLREWLPLVILMACPLMHVFGHGHHGHHTGHSSPGHKSGARSRSTHGSVSVSADWTAAEERLHAVPF